MAPLDISSDDSILSISVGILKQRYNIKNLLLFYDDYILKRPAPPRARDALVRWQAPLHDTRKTDAYQYQDRWHLYRELPCTDISRSAELPTIDLSAIYQ